MISKRKRNTIYAYCMASMIMLLSLVSNITEVTTQLSNSKRVVADNQVVSENNISYGLVAIEASSSIEKNDAKVDTEEEKKEEIKSEKTSNKEKSSKKKTQTSTKKTAKKTSTVKKAKKPVKLPSNKELGKQIVEYAKQFIGNPYKSGGTSLTKGADCSGFTQSVYKHFGISLSRTAASQSYQGVQVPFSKLEPGDLVFYSNGGGISHVGIYIGKGKIVHAGTPKTGICTTSVNIMTKVTARRVVK